MLKKLIVAVIAVPLAALIAVWMAVDSLDYESLASPPVVHAYVSGVRLKLMTHQETIDAAKGHVPFSISIGQHPDHVFVESPSGKVRVDYKDYGFTKVLGRMWLWESRTEEPSAYAFTTDISGRINVSLFSQTFEKAELPGKEKYEARPRPEQVERCEPGPEVRFSSHPWSYLTLARSPQSCVLIPERGARRPVALTFVWWRDWLRSKKLAARVCEELTHGEPLDPEALYGGCIFVDRYRRGKKPFPVRELWYALTPDRPAFFDSKFTASGFETRRSIGKAPVWASALQ